MPVASLAPRSHPAFPVSTGFGLDPPAAPASSNSPESSQLIDRLLLPKIEMQTLPSEDLGGSVSSLTSLAPSPFLRGSPWPRSRVDGSGFSFGDQAADDIVVFDPNYQPLDPRGLSVSGRATLDDDSAGSILRLPIAAGEVSPVVVPAAIEPSQGNYPPASLIVSELKWSAVFSRADCIYIFIQIIIMSLLLVWALRAARDAIQQIWRRRHSTLLSGGSVRAWFICSLAAGISVRVVTDVIIALAAVRYQVILTPFSVALAYCTAEMLSISSYSMIAGFFAEVAARAAQTPTLIDSGRDTLTSREGPLWTPVLVGANVLLYIAFAATTSVTKIRHAHKEFRMCALFLLGVTHLFLAALWVLVGARLVSWIRRRRRFARKVIGGSTAATLEAIAAANYGSTGLHKDPSMPLLLSAAAPAPSVPTDLLAAPSTGSSTSNSQPHSRATSAGGCIATSAALAPSTSSGKGICVLVTMPPASALEVPSNSRSRGAFSLQDSPAIVVDLAASPSSLPRATSARSLLGGALPSGASACSGQFPAPPPASLSAGGPVAISLVSSEVVITLIWRLTLLATLCPPAFLVNGILQLRFAKQLWDVLSTSESAALPVGSNLLAPADYLTSWSWINGLLFLSQIWPAAAVLSVFGNNWHLHSWMDRLPLSFKPFQGLLWLPRSFSCAVRVVSPHTTSDRTPDPSGPSGDSGQLGLSGLAGSAGRSHFGGGGSDTQLLHGADELVAELREPFLEEAAQAIESRPMTSVSGSSGRASLIGEVAAAECLRP